MSRQRLEQITIITDAIKIGRFPFLDHIAKERIDEALYDVTSLLVDFGIGTKDRFEIEVIPRGIGHNGMEMYKTNIQPINYEEDK